MTFLDGVGFNNVQNMLGTQSNQNVLKSQANEPIFGPGKRNKMKGKGFDLSRKDIKTLEKMGPKGEELLAMLADFPSSTEKSDLRYVALRNKAMEVLVADGDIYDKDTYKLLSKFGISEDEYKAKLDANHESAELYIDYYLDENNELVVQSPVNVVSGKNYAGKFLEILQFEDGNIIYKLRNDKYASDFKQTVDKNGDVTFEQNAFVFPQDSTGAPLLDKGPIWELGSKYVNITEQKDGSWSKVEFTREAVKTPDGKIEMVLKGADGKLYPIDFQGYPSNGSYKNAEKLFGKGSFVLENYDVREPGSKHFDGASLLMDGKIYYGTVVVERDGTVIPTFINSEGKEMCISEYGDKVVLEDYELSHAGSIGNLSPRWEVGNTVEGGFTTALTKDYTPVYIKDGKQYQVNPETGELARDSVTGEPIPFE